MQWTASLRGFLERPLLGYGPENHNLVWSANFDPGIYAVETDVFDRAHNQYLELLGTTGAVGTVAFFFIWGALGFTLYRGYKTQRISSTTLALLVGLQVSYATYLVFWFFDLNSTMLWILFASLTASLADPVTIIRPQGMQSSNNRALGWGLGVASTLLLVVLLDFQAYQPLRASRTLAAVDAYTEEPSQLVGAINVLAESPVGQTAHTPGAIGAFVVNLFSRYSVPSTDFRERELADQAFMIAIRSFRAEIHRDTLNDRLYANEARLLFAAADFYGTDSYRQEGIAALQHAITLSPRRIQPRLSLATTLLRQGDTTNARVVLADAVSADPELGEPRFRLGTLLGSSKIDSAARLMRESLALGYVGSPDQYLAIGKRLEFSGKPAAAAALYSEYLEAKYTKAVWEPSGIIGKSIPATDIAVAAHLPLLYVRAEESELAIKSAAALALFVPSQSEVVDRFVLDVGSRRRRTWLARNSLLSCGSTRSRAAADSAALGACAVFRRKL
jgi:hypothetical protein